MTDEALASRGRNRFLDGVERLGNALPDPVFIFIGIIAILIAVSAVGGAAGWSAVNPASGEVLVAKSLLTGENISKFLVEMPRTYTGFAPLGLALTIVLGAGVADRSGLLTAMMRGSLGGVPRAMLTPVVFVVGMLTCHAVDAGYLVYVPLAGLAYAAAGRHPVLGIVVGFAGAAVGLSGNLLPGQYDVLILGITETGARLVDPTWTMNPLGNWYFSLAVAFVFTSLMWIIVERVVEPRLGPWRGGGPAVEEFEARRLTPDERRGLVAAGVAAAVVAALFAMLVLWPGGAPLRDAEAVGSQRYTPFFRSLTAGIAIIFFATGWAYGAATGAVRSHRDVVDMMVEGLKPMAPYLVLVFFAAHFVAMFQWSNLGPITAILGAEQLRAMNAAPALLLPLLASMSAWLDFLIASGSAKWAAMAPVAAPMMMLLGISPEMTTAAYRIGDTVTNLISPLNAYLLLALTFARRWAPDMRLGTLISLLLPIAIAFYLGGTMLTALWVALELPVGPGASVSYTLPGT